MLGEFKRILRDTAVAAAMTSLAVSAVPSTSNAADLFKGGEETTTTTRNIWDGGYIGIHAGWGEADRDWAAVGCVFFVICDFNTGSYDQDGGLIGLQAGYNFAFGSGPWIIGFEVDANLTGMDGDTNFFGGGAPGFFDFSAEWLWTATATGRLGYAYGNWLFYAEGGLALAESRMTTALGCTYEVQHEGYVIGGGFEWRVRKNASLGVEYNHIDFDDEDATCTTLFQSVFATVDSEIDMVKARLNIFLN